MTRLPRALCASVLSALLVIAAAPPALAADTQPPELVSIHRTTADELGSGDYDAAEVLVDAHDDSGISLIVINTRLDTPDGPLRCLYNGSLQTWGEQGPWTVKLCGLRELGWNPAPTTVVVESVELTDMAGNTATVSDRSILDPLQYRILNPDYDGDPPQLVSIKVEPAVVTPGEPVTVQATVADASTHAGSSHHFEQSWVADGICCHPQLNSTHKDNKDGTFTNTVTYNTSDDTEYGTYPIKDLTLSDEFYNRVVVPTDAAVVIDDPAHPVGDTRMDGTFAVGQRITGVTNGWDSAAELSYSWYRSGQSPQTGPDDYRLTVDNYSSWVHLDVTGTWPDGTVRIRRTSSPRIDLGTFGFHPPALSSSPVVGRRVGLDYPRPTRDTYTHWARQTYQWLRNGSPIKGAQSRAYAPVAADLAQRLSVRVTTSAPGYTDATEESPSVVVQARTPPAPVLTDVPANHSYFDAITWVASQGITTGYGDGTFRSSKSISRAETASFLYRLIAPRFAAPTRSDFHDVPTSHAHHRAIAWMKEERISTGYADGAFRPERTITRGEFAKLLHGMVDPEFLVPERPPFADMKATDPYYRYAAWMATTGISTGYQDRTFRPNRPISRGEMAQLLYKFDAATFV